MICFDTERLLSAAIRRLRHDCRFTMILLPAFYLLHSVPSRFESPRLLLLFPLFWLPPSRERPATKRRQNDWNEILRGDESDMWENETT